MTLKTYFYIIISLLMLNGVIPEATAQNRIIGIVTDSLTHEALPFISISLEGTTIGTMTDNSGKFSLIIPTFIINLYCHYSQTTGYIFAS